MKASTKVRQTLRKGNAMVGGLFDAVTETVGPLTRTAVVTLERWEAEAMANAHVSELERATSTMYAIHEEMERQKAFYTETGITPGSDEDPLVLHAEYLLNKRGF